MSFEERLIELVKTRPALYSKMHENHKNIYIKEQLWNEISKQLGSSVKRSKARWKTLRNTFRVELTKNMTSTSGVRRTIWKYYDLMMFLKDDVVSEMKKFGNPPIMDEATTQNESLDSITPKKEHKELPKQSQNIIEKGDIQQQSQICLEKEMLPEKSQTFLERDERNNTIVFMDQAYLDKGEKTKTKDFTDQNYLEKEERNETTVFMESMVIKIRKANLSCDELDELQEAILSLINSKLREFRQKRAKSN